MASSPRRPRSPSRGGSRSSPSSPRSASRASSCAAGPSRPSRGLLEAAAPLIFKAQTGTFRRPKARARAFQGAFYDPRQIRPELLWEFFTGGERGERFVEALTSIAGYDIHDRLEEVDVPALVVWGRQDRIVPAADAPEYARLLQNSRLEVFDQSGHLPMAEHPLRFNRVLEGFLAERV